MGPGGAFQTAEPAEEQRPLPWENRAEMASLRAFWATLGELLLRPARFFTRMAVCGGLNEPLTFFWILSGLCILLSFPLALTYFALTAPDPETVTVSVYQQHLLASQITGSISILSPVVTVALGVTLILLGSLFHVGAGWFGALNWEGTISIVCYSGSLALVPVAAGMAAGFLVAFLCYLVAFIGPGAAAGAGAVTAWVAPTVLILALVVGGVLFLLGLILGFSRTFRLGTLRGAGAALAGLILAVGLPALVVHAFRSRGPVLGFICLGAAGVALSVLALAHRLVGPRANDTTGPA